jgi:AcrR family transcriptional regulator
MARRHRSVPKSDKDTRQQLLEAAGQVFGEKGFDRATGKEISERAGTNTAAINYYFGGLEALYDTVLEEAHRRLFTFDNLAAAVAAEPDAAAKLHAITTTIVCAATGPLSSSWVLRVIGREIVAPSLAREPREGDTDSVSKLRLIREVMGEYMGLPENHPGVARACISVISPFLVLLMTDRPTLRRIFAGAGLAPTDADALIEDIHCYMLAGLAALANRSRKSGTAGAPPIRDGTRRKPRRTPARKTAAS